jgi:hypothetical protein
MCSSAELMTSLANPRNPLKGETFHYTGQQADSRDVCGRRRR